MPLKSWAFEHNGHAVRAEIWWRFSGWHRKRLYVDHRLALAREGRFAWGWPIEAEIAGAGGKKQILQVRFRPKRFALDMGCDCRIDGERISWTGRAVQIEKKRQHTGSSDGYAGVIHDNQTLGCLIVFPLLLGLWVAALVLVPLGGILSAIAQRRLLARLRRRMRLLSWPEVEQRLSAQASTSTLIVQVGHMTPRRAWWTEDDVLAKSPLPLPNALDMIFPGRQSHPFVEWCDHVYTSDKTGKAFLTELPESIARELDFFETPHDPACCRSRYSTLNVVITGYAHGKRAKAGPWLVSTLGENLIESVPRAIAGLQHTDPTIREISRELVALAGPAAEDAVWILKRQLYWGPWKERYPVAVAMAELGPAGLGVLREAARLADPYLHVPSRPVLNMHERRRVNSNKKGA